MFADFLLSDFSTILQVWAMSDPGVIKKSGTSQMPDFPWKLQQAAEVLCRSGSSPPPDLFFLIGLWPDFQKSSTTVVNHFEDLI